MTKQLWCLVATVVLMGTLQNSIMRLGKDAMRSIDYANRTNTYLHAVLPAANAPGAALDILGLPASCAKAIGLSWFNAGVQENHPCPEVRQVSRLRLLPLFWAQPRTFFIPVYQALLKTQQIVPQALGIHATPQEADTPKFKLLWATSLTSLVRSFPPLLFVVLCTVAVVVGSGALAAPLMQTQRMQTVGRQTHGACIMIGLGGTMILYAVVSSVFGDGYPDVVRHAQLLFPGLVLHWMGLLILFGFSITRPAS